MNTLNLQSLISKYERYISYEQRLFDKYSNPQSGQFDNELAEIAYRSKINFKIVLNDLKELVN